jgi:hypothetical protein
VNAFHRKFFVVSSFYKILFVSLFCIFSHLADLKSQPAGKPDQVEIAESGIMYWRDSGNAVTGFGVNYTTPFAHAYRQAKRMGVNLKAAIDQDIYQFARLDLDLYRVHVWDCEISDSLGNLLQNEHLELFDYLLHQLKLHKINAVITPIAYWGNGWPEPDEKTPGFSSKYGKDECLVNPEAIAAQERYLAQFVNHVNPYTGVAYKDEPSILAFEISNEPHHRGTPDEVKSFIKKMVASIESTGCTKPIFYNVSHSIHLAHSYFESGIQGGTFQWYPTGLGFQKELGGNLLPNVDKYQIPFDDVMQQHHAARLVYEFDAADMASTYMYPAMARSFRSAGMQIGTHFSYDPTFLAPVNTEYNTHYMNLQYAPRKALSLLISGEVFRTVPLNQSFPPYPANAKFGPFRVDYESDLAEMVTEDKFYYTNHTTTTPPAPEKLTHIAGWGNSPIVQYEGTGAYFLDRIIPGMWLLEVYPDAITIDNLFGRNAPEKIRTVINHRTWPIQIELPEFHDGIFVGDMQSGNTNELKRASFTVKPGVYLLTTPEVILDNKGFMKAYQYLDSLKPDQFYKHVVATTVKDDHVLITAPPEVSINDSLSIQCTVIGPAFPDSVSIWFYHQSRPISLRMNRIHGYTYSLTIPPTRLDEGNFTYFISTHYQGKSISFPAGTEKQPGDWDFDATRHYSIRVVPADHPLYLFDATTDVDRLNRRWLPDAKVMPDAERNKDYLYLKIDELIEADPENPYGVKIADYSMRHYVGDLVKGRNQKRAEATKLVLDAFTPEKQTLPVQVSLVMKDGSAFGKTITISSRKKQYAIYLKDLQRVHAVLLPRPYPTFLPYYSEAGVATVLDMREVESLQVSIGPGLKTEQAKNVIELNLGRVWIE